MGDVEFLVGPDFEPVPPDPVEDVVDVEPRRAPRWMVIGGAALAAVLLLAALVARTHSAPNRPAAAAAPSQASSQASSPAARGDLAPLPTSPVGRVLPADDQIALDVELAGNILYSLRYDTLRTTDALTGQVLGAVRVNGLDFFYGGPTMHLALDSASFTAWVFTQQVSPPRVLEFNSASLRQRRGLRAPGTIFGAATMNGRLYLATSAGVAVVTPRHGMPRVLPTTSGMIASIAADPTRNRLLAIDASSPQHLLTISPSGAVNVVATIAPVVSPTLAVSGGRVWLAGDTDAGAVVVRLDPTSLLPVAASEVAQRAGASVALTGGESVVWVSSGGGTQQQQLWCIDATTGDIGGYWPLLTGAVSSRTGLAYAVRGGTVVGLPTSSGCPG